MLKIYVLLAVLSLTTLAGCGVPRPSPEEVIARATDAANEPQTYRFEMTGTMTLEGETSQGSMQGEFVSPDRSHVEMTSDGDTQESIIIGQTLYRRASGSNSWEVDQSSAAIALATAYTRWLTSTVEIVDSLVGVVELRDEKIDGVSCFHYRGSVDMESRVQEQIANLDPTLPGYEEMVRTIEQQLQSEHNVEFWIGKEDYLLRQMEVYQDMIYTDDVGEDTEREERYIVNYTLRFFDFNQLIIIRPPVVE